MTPEEAKPHCAGAAHNTLLDQDCGGEPFPPWFTAKETAEIAKAYGELCRFTRKVHGELRDLVNGEDAKRRRRVYRLFIRCCQARSQWQYKLEEWIK